MRSKVALRCSVSHVASCTGSVVYGSGLTGFVEAYNCKAVSSARNNACRPPQVAEQQRSLGGMS